VNTTKPLAVVTNSQPILSMTHVSASVDAVARESVLTKPQTMKAIATTAGIPKTSGSRPSGPGFFSSSSLASSAG
jgi:hypothetical protein